MPIPITSRGLSKNSVGYMEPVTKKYSPSDVPILHDTDRYEFIKNIGSGNFGIARLMRDKQVDELVAIKYIERGGRVRFAF